MLYFKGVLARVLSVPVCQPFFLPPQVGAAISALQPELIVLTTPHGMALERDFAVYENSNASGFASIGADLHNASFPQVWRAGAAARC